MIHLINSGSASLDGCGQMLKDGNPAMKPYWEISEAEVKKCLDATTWYPASQEYFRGGGYSSNFLTSGGMPVTMSRINLVKGIGPVLQIAEGWTADLPADCINCWMNARTRPGQPPGLYRVYRQRSICDVYSVMYNWGANHGAFSFGHIGADLITLASMLRIPVCMHNVEDKDIFRPSAWGAFGMDAEGSDFRACQVYGACINDE